MPIGFKVLAEDGAAHHGGKGKWFLPTGSKPAKWMPVIKDIKLCKRGYHICRHETDLLAWLGPTIWCVEYRGDVKIGDDKLVAEQARLISRFDTWNDRTARLFAADCAERVLKHIPESHRAPFVNSIKVARDFANGKATVGELESAARAAWAASTAWAASAASAARAASAASAARAASAASTAWAVRAASAAWAASAARAASAASTERKWQAARLKKYLSGEIK
jgi:hypothetical protein